MSEVPVIVPKGFRVVAHRGASGYAPENTLAAFRLAREMGARDVEFDVRLSSDGVAMICHDDTLERYGHGPRRVEEMTSKELLALDMGSWFSPHFFAGERMTTLTRIFETFRDEFGYEVEIKGATPGVERETARLIRKFGVGRRVVVTSFRIDALERMKAEAPDLRLGWLVQQLDDAALDGAKRLGLFQLSPLATNASGVDVARAKSVVREVRPWGLLGGPSQVRALIRAVADAGGDGITLNWPDWARSEEE